MQNIPTKRQKDLLEFIYSYINNERYPPTFEEMRENLGVSSNQSVIDLLDKLKQKELIKKNSSGARSIVILPLGYEALGKLPLAPFLGVTSAGSMLEAVEISGEWETVSPEVAKLGDEIFLLKISGDSMINAGIDDGDVVLAKKEKEFYSGEIVLAQVGDTTTVKRFISEDKAPYLYLKPENPKYEKILFRDDVCLKAKIISILKNGSWKGVKKRG